MSKAVLEAGKRLEAGDSIQKTYLGTYSGKYGNIMFSKKKTLFVVEEGFFNKTYRVLLDLPFKEMKSHEVVDKYTLRITDAQGKNYEVKSDMPVSILVETLKKMLETGGTIPA